MKIQLIKVIFFFLSISLSYAQQNLLTRSNSLKFAQYLLTTAQYDYAQEEYERVIYFYPKDTTAILSIVDVYTFGGKCQKLDYSLDLLSRIDKPRTNLIFWKKYLNLSLKCKSFDNNYNRFVNLMKEGEKEYYALSKSWLSNDFEKIKNFEIKKSPKNNSKFEKLLRLTKQYKRKKFKKPGLALIMSAIIPGSGKAYSKRWGDAFVSFIFVASNAWISYRAFNKKGISSVNGWIFGGLSFSFYVSNIWGSFKAAKNYNNHIKHTYQREAENIIYHNF